MGFDDHGGGQAQDAAGFGKISTTSALTDPTPEQRRAFDLIDTTNPLQAA